LFNFFISSAGGSGMKKILFAAPFLLSLMVCVTSPAWAGGLDDAKAGETAFQRGNDDEAIRLFTRAIASGELSRRDLGIAYYNRGNVWYYKGDYDKAIADYTKAIEINPQYASAYENRGLAWADKGDYDKAIADYTKAIEIDPKYAKAYYKRGLAWEKKGDLNKAKADYDKAKEINPRLR
jgi:tetratricopeptide (TPR) repeat protein